MRALVLSSLLLSSLVWAQSEPTAPPLVPTEDEAVAPPSVPPTPTAYADPTYFQRCFSVPGQVWIPVSSGRYYSVSASSAASLSDFHASAPVVPTTTPASSTTSGGSAPSGGSGGGSMDGRALLILAVVLVAALPVVIYAVDSDAPVAVEQRFHCPTFGFDLTGGVEVGAPSGFAGAGSGRFTFGYGSFGSDVQFDLSSGAARSLSGHLMLRFAPKKHVEPNLAVGFRTMTLGGSVRSGVEFGVPHRYVFWRDGLRQLSLELRPTLMVGFNGALDAGLESAVLIPIAEPVHLRFGARVRSFGREIIGGFDAGLTLTL